MTRCTKGSIAYFRRLLVFLACFAAIEILGDFDDKRVHEV